MISRLIVGGLTFAIGVLLALVPQYIFPVCTHTLALAAANVSVPMKCFWTGQATTALGLVICLNGLMLGLCGSYAIRLGLSLGALLLGVVVIALAGFFIGVCAAPTMDCRMGTLPAIYLLSACLFVLSAINILYLRAKIKKQSEVE